MLLVVSTVVVPDSVVVVGADVEVVGWPVVVNAVVDGSAVVVEVVVLWTVVTELE